MIVLKFGGTSVGDAELMNQVLDIAWAQKDRSPVLVSSAMARTTDTLLRIGVAALEGDEEQAKSELQFLKDLHYPVLYALTARATATIADQGKSGIDGLFEQLASLMKGLVLVHEVSPRSQDALVSFGEGLSTHLLWTAAQARGIPSTLIDSRTCVVTDENFTAASLNKDESYRRIKEFVHPQKDHLVIAQGFIGSTLSGITTTLGRGGSDYSATIFGAALDAEEVQIWTDVTGIMTSDPRLIPAARTIEEISYEEAAELAYFGAKVIHPSTIAPAIEKSIPVFVKNTKEPQAYGTRIHSRQPGTGPKGIQAITSKKGITIITVKSSRMLNAYGFLQAIFSVFAARKIPVDLVTTSEVSVSLTVEDTPALAPALQDLREFSQVEIQPNHSILSLVGADLWKEGTLTSKVFSALKGIPIRMISLGGSDINLSLAVPAQHLEESVKRLHRELFE
ncbi:MAG: lysine-sensitive aspartokinase 3 [Spirochaetales bacterium]|nr:lysine-sensitive aspartokinase 3 [Spirochaetales bacterium]